MPRKPAHQQFDTPSAVREHAFRLFGRFGYEGVSIGDIARAAHLSKGALYWHFDDKQSLYLDCLRALHAVFNEYIFDPMRAQTDGVTRHLTLFTGLGRFLNDPRVTPGIAGYWLIPSRPDTARLLQAQRAFETACIETMKDTLRLGVEQGRFDYKGDLDDMARAIIALVEAVVVPMRHQSAEEVRRILGVLARSLFRAYATAGDLLKLTRSL
ncbi:MAG TPA: TetR/AcrR family transcriptional regulator [Candidatus Binatia bacterium]|nr:TetR/AcrR family transcriptional regulator [Candidatus Binatia bacterium]